jgi:hypothetical protein
LTESNLTNLGQIRTPIIGKYLGALSTQRMSALGQKRTSLQKLFAIIAAALYELRENVGVIARQLTTVLPLCFEIRTVQAPEVKDEAPHGMLSLMSKAPQANTINGKYFLPRVTLISDRRCQPKCRAE